MLPEWMRTVLLSLGVVAVATLAVYHRIHRVGFRTMSPKMARTLRNAGQPSTNQTLK
jgi:hypothetical protein